MFNSDLVLIQDLVGSPSAGGVGGPCVFSSKVYKLSPNLAMVILSLRANGSYNGNLSGSIAMPFKVLTSKHRLYIGSSYYTVLFTSTSCTISGSINVESGEESKHVLLLQTS